MSICFICLRTDKLINHNKELTEFHSELCGSTELISNTCLLYCHECEHLLMKFYKFKQKCLLASKIYQDWVTGDMKNSIHSLHKLLPPSSLGMWFVNPKQIGTFDFQSTITESDYVTSNSTLQELIKNERNLEYVLTDSNNSIVDKSCDDVAVKIEHKDIQEKDASENLVEPDCTVEENYVKNEICLSEVRKCQNNIKINKDKSIVKEKPNPSKKRKITLNKKSNVSTQKTVNKHDCQQNDIKSDTDESYVKEKEKPKKIQMTISIKETNVDKQRKVTYDRKIADTKWINKSKEELIKRLSSLGDIDDGVAIDMDLIAKYIQNDAGLGTVRGLQRVIGGDDNITHITPELKSKLLSIQTNYDKSKQDKLYYISIFDIQYLKTQEEKIQEFERRKTYECYIQAEFKCDICYQPFKGAVHLKSHMKNFHDESVGARFCPICKMRTGGGKRERHTHRAVYSCRLCPLVTYHNNSMKVHAEKHRGKKYKCAECNLSFNCTSSYYSHMSTHRGPRVRCVCRVCGRGFPSEKSVQVHAAVKHRDAPAEAEGAGVRCDECDVTFPSQGVFEAHITDVHEPLGRIEADDCAVQSTMKFRRRAPRSGTVSEQKCRLCNKRERGAAWLKPHYRREHPGVNLGLLYADKRAYLCHVCGATYYSPLGLRGHMASHSDERPFACDLCSKRFRKAFDLTNHRLYHFPPALPCRLCRRKLHTKSNLYNHMKAHGYTVRSHKCQFCQKAFFTNCTLNEHIRGVHYNVRRVRRRGGGGKTPCSARVGNMDETDESAINGGCQ